MRKLVSFFVMAGLLSWQVPTFAGYMMTPRQAFYYHAHKGSLLGLQKLKAAGYSVNMSDQYGNSALCESVYRQDYSAFAMLKQVGATTAHPCVSKIPQQTVQQFNQGYANWAQAVNSGKIAYAGASAQTATTTTASTTTSTATTTGATATGTTVAATSGLSTAAMVGIGVGAVAVIGGGIALASSGGGGGSKGGAYIPSTPKECSGHGKKNDEGICQCDTGYNGENCADCAGGYGKYGTNTCHLTKCNLSHGSQVGDSCVCNTGWTGDELCNTATTCGTNYVASCPTGYTHSKTCKSGDSTLKLCDTCATHYKKIGGECVEEISCNGHGTQTGDNICTCNEGYNPATHCATCDTANDYGDYGTTECYLNQNCDASKHLHQEGGNCVCDNGFPYEYNGTCYAPIAGGCGTNEMQQGNECVCKPGYEKVAGVCTLTTCPANTYKNENDCVACPAHSTSPVGSTSSTACVCDAGYSKSTSGVCVKDQANVTGTGSVFKLGVDTGYKVYTNTDDLTVSAANKPGLSVLNNGTIINKGKITGQAQEYQDTIYVPGYGNFNFPGFGGIQGMTGYFDSTAPNNSSIKMVNNSDINLTHEGKNEWEGGLDYTMSGMLITPKYNTLSTMTKERNVSVQNYSIDIENNGNITIGSENNDYSFDDYGIAVMPGLEDYITLEQAINPSYIAPTSDNISVSNKGTIHLNSDTAHSGIYVYSSGGSVNIENMGNINLDSAGNGIILGGNTSNGSISNFGNIRVTGREESTIDTYNNVEELYGIKAISNTAVVNDGNITLSSGTVGYLHGIDSIGNILNGTNGTITISGSNFGKGIYVDLQKENVEKFTSDSVTVENKGTITAGTGIEFLLEGIDETQTPTINVINSGTINTLNAAAVGSSAENYSGGVGIALLYNTNSKGPNTYNVTIENSGTINTADSKGTGILGLDNTLLTNSDMTETITNTGSGNINGTIDAQWGSYDDKNGATVVNYGKIYTKKAFSPVVSGKTITNKAEGVIEYEADLNDYLASGFPYTSSYIQGIDAVYNYGTLKNVEVHADSVYNYGNIILDYDIDSALLSGKYVYNESDIQTKNGGRILYGDVVENYGNLQGRIEGGKITNEGNITNGYISVTEELINSGNITATGMGIHGVNSAINNTGNITAEQIGIYGSNSNITNTGDITITTTNSTMLQDYGIKALGGSVNNSGAIMVNGYGGGIYSQGASVINSGNITITDARGVGIYAMGGSVYNTGTITIADESKDGSEAGYCYTHDCYYFDGKNWSYQSGTNGAGHYKSRTGSGTSEDPYVYSDFYAKTTDFIVLHNAQLLTSGTIDAGTSSLNTASMSDGTGKVVLLPKAKLASQISVAGPAYLSTDFVMNNSDTTVVAKDMIQTPDASKLNLISQSALFDAKLADNGSDVIMQMKNFNSVTDNATLAGFLATNYALGNNEAFFNKLKSFGSMSSLTESLNKLTGKDMLSRFNFEDMTMMRELNFDMNEKLFHNKEQHFALAGSVSPMAFRGDTGSNARYSLYNKRSGNTSIGLGVAFTDVRSDDDHDNNNRKETSYQLILPMGYKTHGFNLMTSPRIGYARGTYDRTGFDEKTYEGTIEKRVFGLMNEARYPMTVGKWTFEPAAEFNILGYQQKGREDAKEFALKIQNQNTYSVEGGIGLYATREEELDKDTTLKMTAGVVAYHEFADPYKLRVGMEGMDGAFTLRDENRSQNRAVVRAGFNYDKEDLSLYGTLMSYIDKENRTSAKTGFKWKF